MSTKTCSTCKHWDPPHSVCGELPGSGTCKFTPQLWDATEWGDSQFGETVRIRNPKYARRLAFVQDGSDYPARLVTMAEFGCVQHEEQ